MEKFIEVYDDIISPKLANHIDFFLKSSRLPFTYAENGTFSVGDAKSTFKPVMGMKYLPDSPYANPTFYLVLQVLYEFCSKKDIMVENLFRVSSYLDFPTKESILDLPPHIDQSFPHWVCLYYINDSDGDTVFFDKNNKEIKRVSPKKGRIAFFDGSIYHCGSTPSNIPRAVVNYNFIGTQL